MDKSDGTSTWLKFFKDAGIPTKSGASYALIFAENRIHKDMLTELTVDYLRLMGITLMGDIIAILRHAKSVHQDSMRKVVILQSKEEPAKKTRSSSVSSSSSASSSNSCTSSDVEMVEVTKSSVKKIPSATARVMNNQIKKESSPRIETKQVKSKVIGKISSVTVPVTEKKHELPVPQKRKIIESELMEVDEPARVNPSTTGASGKSILKTATSSAKNIRVTAENDMIGPKLPPPKKTVFDRLGAENSSPLVSSTTEVPVAIPEEEVVETKFTRIISTVSLGPKINSKPLNIPMKPITRTEKVQPKVSSVFDRLGGLNEDRSRTETKSSGLKYVGVLKSSPSTTIKPTMIIKKVGTMRADEPELPVKLRAATTPSLSRNLKISVTDVAPQIRPRLKLNRSILSRERTTNTGSQGIFANENKGASLSVKERLGGHSSHPGSVSSTKTSIKRVRRAQSPVTVKTKRAYMDAYDDEEDNGHVFSSRVEMLDSKKVSFGRVEKRLIPSVKALKIKKNSLQSDKSLTIRHAVRSRLGSRGRFGSYGRY